MSVRFLQLKMQAGNRDCFGTKFKLNHIRPNNDLGVLEVPVHFSNIVPRGASIKSMHTNVDNGVA